MDVGGPASTLSHQARINFGKLLCNMWRFIRLDYLLPVCVCACVCVRACVRACVRVCVCTICVAVNKRETECQKLQRC